MSEEIASNNYAKFIYMRDRGHLDFCIRAQKNTRFYEGDQWSSEAREHAARNFLPCFDYNEIKPAVDAALSFQLSHRMDIQFKPVGGEADTSRAEILSKLTMHEFGRNDYAYVEADMFRDGLITSRGFVDVRPDMSSGNMDGEVSITLLDPRDVIIDPDAKSYDPKGWKRVAVTRWLCGDEVEALYGKAKRKLLEDYHPEGSKDWGEGGLDVRSKIGGEFADFSQSSANTMELATKRYRVVDMQERRLARRRCMVLSVNDIVPVDSVSEERYMELKAMGARERNMDYSVIRWTVSTDRVVLHDKDSPLDDFTIAMFCPHFIRGSTTGMVDNAIGPQEAYNKAMSMAVHNVNATAQNIWLIPKDCLHDIDVEDFERMGSKAGMAIQYDPAKGKPEKVGPNPVPPGFDWIMTQSLKTIRDVTVPEAMSGIQGKEISGVAIQSRQFAAQQQLSTSLDSLSRTRKIVARIALGIIQKFYSGNRIIRITEVDPNTGKDFEKPLEINGRDEVSGGIMNDITVGKYDVVVSQQPIHDTFNNSQLTQALELRNAGVQVPDSVLIRSCNLSDKFDILSEMKRQEGARVDPIAEAKANLMAIQAKKVEAEISKIKADTVETRSTSIYTLTQAAGGLASNVHLVKAIDLLGKSVGFEDQNGGTVLDGQMAQQEAAMNLVPDSQPPAQGNPNTSPMFPSNPVSPAVGVNQGIETMPNDMITSDRAPGMGFQ